MHDTLGFWKRAALILALIAFMSIIWGMDARDAEITAKHEAEAQARKAIRPCDLTIAQFGPGERWYGHQHVYECVAAAREVPNHILTMPIQEER